VGSERATAGRVVRVLPDEAAIDRVFDYWLPDSLAHAESVRIGTMVRAPLHGRRIGGWITGIDVEPPAGVQLADIAKIRGYGPPADVVALCEWVAWRWAGRLANVMRFASPGGAVVGLPQAPNRWRVPTGQSDDLAAAAVGAAATSASASDDRWRPVVVRWPPSLAMMPLVRTAVAHVAEQGGSALIVLPDAARVDAAARALRSDGVPVAVMPFDWARAAAGNAVVIGPRGTVFAPPVDVAIAVLIDEHDDALVDERVPTWHARDVLVERCRRGNIPCVLASPCPSVDALAMLKTSADLVVAARAVERAGWSAVRVIDRTTEDPKRRPTVCDAALAALRLPGRTIAVVNRTGSGSLLTCRSCQHIASCERCGAAVREDERNGQSLLVCPVCATSRPVVCAHCGGARFAVRRGGTAKLKRDLEASLVEPVGEVTATTTELPDERVLVGTEAVLRRVSKAAAVVFVDLDIDLLAPRFRAPEHALALVARACRVVGGREGQVVVQTTAADHQALEAVRHADPSRFSDAEMMRRRDLRLPPVGALAAVSGAGAGAVADALRRTAPDAGVMVGASGDHVLVRAPSWAVLADAFAAIDDAREISERYRVEVDPERV
jgi:primosomal protein N' (replication factor Y) (superfamily II helicase)